MVFNVNLSNTNEIMRRIPNYQWLQLQIDNQMIIVLITLSQADLGKILSYNQY